MDDMKQYTLPRDGDRRLQFTGELIGEAEHGSGGSSGLRADWTRGVLVRIYRTAAGAFVLWRHRWTKWLGERDGAEAAVYATPADLLAGLRGNDGTIRPAERAAWDGACDADDALAAIEFETVE